MKISVILRVKNITGKACFLFSPFPDKLCQERISLSWLWLTVGPYSVSMYIGFVKTRTVSLYFLPCDWEKVWVERNWIFSDKDLYHFHRSYRTLYVYSLVYVNKKNSWIYLREKRILIVVFSSDYMSQTDPWQPFVVHQNCHCTKWAKNT